MNERWRHVNGVEDGQQGLQLGFGQQRRYAELADRRDKEFLHHLSRDDTVAGVSKVGDEVATSALLIRRASVLSIKQNVCVEKELTGHTALRGSSVARASCQDGRPLAETIRSQRLAGRILRPWQAARPPGRY